MRDEFRFDSGGESLAGVGGGAGRRDGQAVGSKIRDVAQQEGRQIAEWQRTADAARQPFREATGDVEFQTDGTSVNTWEGWREMEIGLFLKREPGATATPKTLYGEGSSLATEKSLKENWSDISPINRAT